MTLKGQVHIRFPWSRPKSSLCRLLSCREFSPKPGFQAIHKYSEDIIFCVLCFDTLISLWQLYSTNAARTEYLWSGVPLWMITLSRNIMCDIRGEKPSVFLPTPLFYFPIIVIWHWHHGSDFVRGVWRLHSCSSFPLEGQKGKSFGALWLVFTLLVLRHQQVSTELPEWPLYLWLKWSQAVDEEDLKTYKSVLL